MPGRHSLSLMLNIRKAVQQKLNARKAQFIVDRLNIYRKNGAAEIKYQEGTV